MKDVKLFAFTAEDFPGLLNPVVQVYTRAFSPPPYRSDKGDQMAFEAAVQRHLERPGFCGYWASDLHGRMVGFVYGYSGGPGQWWYDTVTRDLDSALVNRWLEDYFELVELAVDPDYQGQGIGGRLHDTILACTRHTTAALTTAQAETPALHLYRKRGWVNLIENYVFPGDEIMRRIMGKDLARGRETY
jgi:GNAT superfamily N-acetyltransferase